MVGSSAATSGHGQSISGVCGSGRRGWFRPSRGRRAPTPPQIRVSEWWRRGSVQPRGGDTALSSQSHCQTEEAEGPWPAKRRPLNRLLPSAPACLPLRDAERREQVEGREAGPVAVRRGLTPRVTLFPCQRLGGAPRALAGQASEGRATGHRGRPQPRAGGVRSTSRVWSLGQAWSRGKGNTLVWTGAHRCPLPPGPRPGAGPRARWTGGREGPVRMWQGGEGDSGQTEAGLGASPWSSSRNSHGSRGADGGTCSRPPAQTDRRVC